MPQLEWVIICLSSAIDKMTNALSIFNVVDELTLSTKVEVPKDGKAVAVGPQLSIVTMWRAGKRDAKGTTSVQIGLSDPTGKRSGFSELNLTLGTNGLGRLIATAPFLPYRGPGIYWVDVRIKSGANGRWKVVARKPLPVKLPSE